MDVLGVLHLDEMSHGLANLSMFPYFDMAHYIVSIMALREQPGKWHTEAKFKRTKAAPPFTLLQGENRTK